MSGLGGGAIIVITLSPCCLISLRESLDTSSLEGDVNIHRNIREWHDLARERGFASMAELLEFYYVERRYSTTKLGDVLDIGRDRAAQLLRHFGIEVRKKGER